jgi:hypothetical protein
LCSMGIGAVSWGTNNLSGNQMTPIQFEDHERPKAHYLCALYTHLQQDVWKQCISYLPEFWILPQMWPWRRYVTVSLIYTCANKVSVPYVNRCTRKSLKPCIPEVDSKMKYLCYVYKSSSSDPSAILNSNLDQLPCGQTRNNDSSSVVTLSTTNFNI